MKLNRGGKRIGWARTGGILFAIIFSALSSYALQPLIGGNKDAVNAVVTIFSILAGFLIAITTFAGDPMLAGAKTWGELQLAKRNFNNRLLRYRIIFFLYLISLGCAFLTYFEYKNAPFLLPLVQYTFLFLSSFVFVVSFTVPGSLMKMQIARYEALLESTKTAEIVDPNSENKTKIGGAGT
jgi:hypothetical protein